MKKVLAECIGVETDLVSIKATTAEKLSFVGREEGVSAYATVLINKIYNPNLSFFLSSRK